MPGGNYGHLCREAAPVELPRSLSPGELLPGGNYGHLCREAAPVELPRSLSRGVVARRQWREAVLMRCLANDGVVGPSMETPEQVQPDLRGVKDCTHPRLCRFQCILPIIPGTTVVAEFRPAACIAACIALAEAISTLTVVKFPLESMIGRLTVATF